MLVLVFLSIIGFFLGSIVLSYILEALLGRPRGLMRPAAIFIITNIYVLVMILWVLGASKRTWVHYVVLGLAIFFWFAIYGKVVIAKPKAGEIGLATVLGAAVPFVFWPGRNFLWQNGQRFVGVDMIIIPAQIENSTLSFDGIPLMKRVEKESMPLGALKIEYAMRWRVNFEDSQAVYRFYYNGLKEGVLKSLADKGSILSQALRALAQRVDGERLLREDPNIFVPIAAHLLLGTPRDQMPRIPKEGMPDILNLGIRVFSFGLSEVSLDRKETPEVLKDKMAAQGIKVMIDTLRGTIPDEVLERLIALQKGARGTVVFSGKKTDGTRVFLEASQRRERKEEDEEEEEEEEKE